MDGTPEIGERLHRIELLTREGGDRRRLLGEVRRLLEEGERANTDPDRPLPAQFASEKGGRPEKQ